MITIAYPWILVGGLGCCALVMILRWWLYKPLYYRYPLTAVIRERSEKHIFSARRLVLYGVRLATVIALVIALARPQIPDERSLQRVEGVDCMLVLDVSGSMEIFDDIKDRQSRLTVAKREAIQFISKRIHDSFGLVLFGSSAVSRCPLTADKKMLREIISDVHIGVVDPTETMLGQAMALAAYRLSSSPAKSKIMIVLTDGVPSPSDVPPHEVLRRIKDAGIKVYTIGIGSEQGGYQEHPLFGVMPAQTQINTQLLQRYAQETGGQFFLARSSKDMARIYESIDALEKTVHDIPVYSKMYDYFPYFLWAALCAVMIEVFLTTWIWQGVA